MIGKVRSSILIFLRQWQKKVESFRGYSDSCVTQDGELVDGLVPGLHTYKGSVDLYTDDHMHLDSEQGRKFTLDIRPDKGKLFLKVDKEMKPHYTLEGLYEGIDSNNMQKRIDALISNLEYFAQYCADDLLEKFNGKTGQSKLLNFLEEKYVELISNQ